MLARLRSGLSDWSLWHWMFDAAISGAIWLLMAAFTTIHWSIPATLAVLTFVAIMAAYAIWKHERHGRITSIADLCDELALRGEHVRTQEEAKDWISDVVVVLMPNHAQELIAFSNITKAINNEKPSADLIAATVRRGILWLKSVGVRIRRVDAIQDRLGAASNQGFATIRRLYENVLERAESVDSREGANRWLKEVQAVLCGTGQTLRWVELNAQLGEMNEDNWEEVLRNAKMFLTTFASFLGDRATEPSFERVSSED